MYFYTGGRQGRGQDVWREIESASREAVSKLRDLFENMVEEGAKQGGVKTDSGAWTPSGDLTEDAGHYYARIELPGTTKSAIDVIWKGEGTILVSGTREATLNEGETLISSTRRTGRFEYRVKLPEGVQVNDETISARYNDGILRITIEKTGTSGTTIEVE